MRPEDLTPEQTELFRERIQPPIAALGQVLARLSYTVWGFFLGGTLLAVVVRLVTHNLLEAAAVAVLLTAIGQVVAWLLVSDPRVRAALEMQNLVGRRAQIWFKEQTGSRFPRNLRAQTQWLDRHRDPAHAVLARETVLWAAKRWAEADVLLAGFEPQTPVEAFDAALTSASRRYVVGLTPDLTRLHEAFEAIQDPVSRRRWRLNLATFEARMAARDGQDYIAQLSARRPGVEIDAEWTFKAVAIRLLQLQWLLVATVIVLLAWL